MYSPTASFKFITARAGEDPVSELLGRRLGLLCATGNWAPIGLSQYLRNLLEYTWARFWSQMISLHKLRNSYLSPGIDVSISSAPVPVPTVIPLGDSDRS